MTLVDSSVWVDFLRGTEGPPTRYVREHLGGDLHTTEPVLLEVLAGARAGGATARLERLLLSQSWVRLDPALDYRGAVDVFHACRADGHPIRSINDCLTAAVALRVGLPVAHRDADFERIAAVTGLTVVDLRG